MPRFPNEIQYGEKYYDDYYEYRHVILPKQIFKTMPRDQKVLTESQWRMMGIQQSRGWVHYDSHKPEPYILLFRRPKGTDPQTGIPPRGFKDPDFLESQQNEQQQMQQDESSIQLQQQVEQNQRQNLNQNIFLRKNVQKYNRYDFFNNTQ
ncbi:cyclin-dependent kinase regulatory subunit (macronuclear) [Tetrahymena thermophila SB210]|uniref:Cyclin-dependent kinases regulatory subunit n=1 Tax=Tetrahymena thermophila (strain SB210) TaxID=312017 RepID=Q22AB9_TETTS|nr:cyclin-dependent kinase regulatory subunit [Tetrahymena thermophila SB210]EAR82230.1 cyclin-dependent kinase regulatory subunit [Tetrahymena thermophila SB210]|eukprot:XP_001029893.1 cyclin-dependent kinase regulatory subunit [Tetrahymena thermophila SB210]